MERQNNSYTESVDERLHLQKEPHFVCGSF